MAVFRRVFQVSYDEETMTYKHMHITIAELSGHEKDFLLNSNCITHDPAENDFSDTICGVPATAEAVDDVFSVFSKYRSIDSFTGEELLAIRDAVFQYLSIEKALADMKCDYQDAARLAGNMSFVCALFDKLRLDPQE